MSVACVFPGQGSQSVGMMSALAAASPIVERTFAEATAVLGYDLWALCANGPDAELAATERTQPAMLAAGVATWRVWRDRGGVMPARMAGHSLGEYTALVCSGALDYPTAIDLVRFRGQAMQSAVPPGTGAMAAILGLDDAGVEVACNEASGTGVVVAANYNSPGQVVIAGTAAAVDRAMQLATARGAKRAVKLSVSVPSHSPLMQPAAAQLAERLASVTFTMPSDTEIYGVNLAPHRSVADIRNGLVEQLVGPVRWSSMVRTLIAVGSQALLECGPGKVLTALNRRIERSREITMVALEDPDSIDLALEAVGAHRS
jgi:[acyl-carrier-protein] S-malonyltransferase